MDAAQATARSRSVCLHGLGRSPADWSAVAPAARDDHYVPLDFAVAAVARTPGRELRILASGGHHAHVNRPALWIDAVTPWLARLA